MVGEGAIVIIDLEEDRFALCFERPEIVFFIRIIGVAEVVEHRDCLDDPVDSFWPRAAMPGVMTAPPPIRYLRNSSLSARIAESGWSWYFSMNEEDERQPGLPLSSPSYEPLQLSGGSGAHQGDRLHRHGKLWKAGVVPGPKGELVACPANDNRFVPTFDQAILERGRGGRA